MNRKEDVGGVEYSRLSCTKVLMHFQVDYRLMHSVNGLKQSCNQFH